MKISTLHERCTAMFLCFFYLQFVLTTLASTTLSYDDASTPPNQEYDLLEDIVRTHRLLPALGGPSHQRSYYFPNNKRRNLKVSNYLLKQIAVDLSSGKDFTFLVTIRQRPNNRGSLIAFTHQRRKRFLELQSVWHRHEYRFHHLFTLAATHVHTERLPYMPMDGRWHKIALTVAGTLVELRVDCRRVFSRRVPFPPPQREFLEPHRRIQLWLGQRGFRRSIFVGSISEAKIVVGPNGHESQCPKEDFHLTNKLESLTELFGTLQQEVRTLRKRAQIAEERLTKLEKCDCAISCKFNGTIVRDGQTVRNGPCSNCTCESGHLKCKSVACPILTCKYPIWPESSCCPMCANTSSGRNCEFRGTSYEHGEARYSKHHNKVCVVCTCNDGMMSCKQYRNFTQICPKLTCSPSEQFISNDHCCSFCPGMDFCSLDGHRCHADADCINLAMRYTCRCKNGFTGNGYHCEDINECDGSPEKACGYNSRCINSRGSYHCQCNPGFERGPYKLCRDIDECNITGICPSSAKCFNTIGSYSCNCTEGYAMKDGNCVPVCPPCHNGGFCIKPNVCRCPYGFYGQFCEKDINECALGIHECSENATCHNTPGSYFCQCRKGFVSSSNNAELCEDVNECDGKAGMTFTCGPTTRCKNTVGGYQCSCRTNSTCTKDCVVATTFHRRSEVRHGSLTNDVHNPCQVCMCEDGVVTCRKKVCNCSSPEDLYCCPECFEGHCIDTFLNRTYKSGQKWTVNCSDCTCFNGTTSCNPVKCSSTRWCEGATKTPKGHCCPICLSWRRSLCQRLSLPSDDQSPTCRTLSKAVQTKFQNEPCLHCHCEESTVCCTQRVGCNSSDHLP